jgi:hypothetical protein
VPVGVGRGGIGDDALDDGTGFSTRLFSLLTPPFVFRRISITYIFHNNKNNKIKRTKNSFIFYTKSSSFDYVKMLA